MTENKAKTLLESKKKEAERITNNFLSYSGGEIRKANLTIEMCDIAIQALEEIQQYRAIGTIEEFKALKEKNTPMELAKHNFQDEPHHYLCPSCRNIVSCNQNYCEECGQALEH